MFILLYSLYFVIMETKIIETSNQILKINTSNLSSLSKIYFISIIKLNLDLLNDIECDENINNDVIINLIKNIICGIVIFILMIMMKKYKNHI